LSRPSVRLLAALWLSGLACTTAGNKAATAWRQEDFITMPIGALSGVPILIYPVAVLIVDPSVEPLGDEASVRARSDSIISAGLMQRTPQVGWVSSQTLRRHAAESDSLPDLETLDLTQINLRALMTVPQPLLGQMRALSGVNAGRYAFVPGQMVVRKRPNGRYRVELKSIIADVRTGGNGWASDAAGEGATPWEALDATVAMLTASAR
jgi:hypothetical protein